MTAKKLIVLLSVSAIVLAIFIGIKLTSVKYYKDYVHNIPTVSDSDYLGVSDLRVLCLFQNTNEEKTLKKITKNLILQSYACDGINNEYTSVISDDLFKRLNPSDVKFKDFKLMDITVDCICYGNKAIAFFSKECSIDSDSCIKCIIGTAVPPFDRVYFEKVNNEWKVVSIFQAA